MSGPQRERQKYAHGKAEGEACLAPASCPAVDLHHAGLVGQAGQHLVHRHLHGAGAHGNFHLGRAVLRAGLGDGHDGCT